MAFSHYFPFADMELDVQERSQLQPTMVCVVSAWPIMLKLEVSAIQLVITFK